MKNYFFGFGILAIAALTLSGTQALACDHGGCYDRESAYTDLLRFSQSSRCPTLSSSQALHLARGISDGQIDLDGFKQAYDASCNLDDSTAAAANAYRAKRFVEVLKSSNASRCPTLPTYRALAVAVADNDRHLIAGEFSRNYDVSCNYDDAWGAAFTVRASEIYRDVLKFSQASRCPTLSSSQVLRLALAADQGREDARDFKMAYNTSCSYDDAYAAARCDRFGMYKGASSPKQALASSQEINEGGKTIVSFETNSSSAPAKSKGSANAVD